MDAAGPYQALREQLRRARVNLDAGDTAAALKAVEAALVIDPGCAAATVLRERIHSRQRIQGRELVQVAAQSEVLELIKTEARWEWETTPEPTAAQAEPIISSQAWALFEKRTRARRVDRCIRTVRTAIAERRSVDADAALAEIRALDPACPELQPLQLQLDSTFHSGGQSGPWLAAALVFGVTVLGASRVDRIDGLLARPIIAATELPTGMPSEFVAEWARNEGAPTEAIPTLRIDSIGLPAVELAFGPQPSIETVPVSVPTLPIAPVFAPTSVQTPGPTPVQDPSPMPLQTPSPIPLPSQVLDDEALVRQALQKYRAAYSGLDARLAQTVWPDVNEAELARAFSGLESQELRFSACQVELQGTAATAVCRGSALYVPKVGGHEPRVESRVWNFALRKASGGWQIETARAE